MRLDQPRVELRPRSPWEAMELGIALVRRHARAIWLPWAAITLPLFVAHIALAWTRDLVPLAALAMWWLKPVFEAPILKVLAEQVFTPPPSYRQCVAATWRLLWRPRLLGDLTWRRLGLRRSLLLPVTVLEATRRANLEPIGAPRTGGPNILNGSKTKV